MNEQGKKVPTLRFKGFTNDWEQRKLGDIVENYDSKRIPIKEKDRKHGKYPYYGATGIIDYIDQYIFDGEYLLLAEDGANIVDRTSPITYITEGKFWLNNHAHIMNSDQVDLLFLKASLDKLKYDKFNTGTAQPKLNAKVVSHIKLNIPSRTEQNRIARMLNNLEKLITLQQRKLDLLKQLKKGLLQKMFAEKNSKQPALRFKGFHDDWEQRKVSDIFTVTRGQVLATTKISEVKTNEMCFPVYSSQTKNNGLMGYYNKYLFNTAITWTTDGANAGTVNYREGKFYSTNVNGVLLSDDGYANKAIAEILDRVAWRHVSRVGNPKLMNNVMSNIKISIPSSFEEQNAISEFLIKFDHLIVLHQRKQNHLKLLKKSLLQQMFM